MKGLVFHWDENQTFKSSKRAQKRLLKQWTHTAKAFGFYNLLIIGKDVPMINDTEINILVFNDYLEIREEYENYKYVIITEKGKDIDSVKFPTKDVLYVVGSNYSDPIVTDGDILVGIKGNIPLWDVVAAGIILHRAQ